MGKWFRTSFYPAFWLTILVAYLIFSSTYKDILTSGFSTYLTQSGDASKNYFTPLYHILHDSSYVHFSGMNYPYGEHIVYTDAQPLISNILKAIHQIAPQSLETWLGVLNLLLFLQVFLTIWVLYRIGKHFNFPDLLAAIIALGIGLLSPQWMRLHGHFALAYTFVLPLVWWLFLRNIVQPRISRSLITALVLFLFGFIHPYLIMISGIFLGLSWLMEAGIKRNITALIHGAISAGLPLFLFKIALYLTDNVTDRPTELFGYQVFSANWKGLFLPYPLFPGADWLPQNPPSFEGTAYIGVLGTVVFAIVLIILIVRIIQNMISGTGIKSRIQNSLRSVSEPMQQLPTGMFPTLIAALLMLVLATGFPFFSHPERWSQIFPPLQQFRSPGRFAWPFFLVWNFGAIYLVWQWARRKHLNFLAFLFPILLVAEGAMLHFQIGRKLQPQIVANAHKQARELLHDHPQDVDAHLILPYFHVGSEMMMANYEPSVELAFPLALETGKPLMNSMMSRTSFLQTWNQLQWLLPYQYEQPSIFADLPQKAQIAIWTLPAETTLDGPPWLKNNRQDSAMSLNVYRVDQLQAAFSTTEDSFNASSCHSSEWVSVESHIIQNSDGTIQLPNLRNNWIKLNDSCLGLSKTLSFWIWAKAPGRPNTYLMIDQRDTQGTLQLWDFGNLNDYIIGMKGDWALVKKPIQFDNTQGILRMNITKFKNTPPFSLIRDIRLDTE